MIDSQACVSSDSDQACTEDFTSIFEPKLISDVDDLQIEGQTVSIFPNPAGDYFTIATNNITGNSAMVDILDIQGKLIYRERINLDTKNTVTTIETAELKSGMYIVSLSTENAVYSNKLIINK